MNDQNLKPAVREDGGGAGVVQTQGAPNGNIFSLFGLYAGVVANLAVLYVTLNFYRTASATQVAVPSRPVGLIAFDIAIVLGSLVFALPPAVMGWAFCRKAGYKPGVLWGTIGTVLSLLPIPLAWGLFHFVTAQLGLKSAI